MDERAPVPVMPPKRPTWEQIKLRDDAAAANRLFMDLFPKLPAGSTLTCHEPHTPPDYRLRVKWADDCVEVMCDRDLLRLAKRFRRISSGVSYWLADIVGRAVIVASFILNIWFLYFEGAVWW